MEHFLLDTNIVIGHLADQYILPNTGNRFSVSTMTVFELLQLAGLSRTEEDKIKIFLAACNQLTITSTIAERAASLARTHYRIGAMDLLIAATALEHHLALITKNLKDFRRLPGLTVRDAIE